MNKSILKHEIRSMKWMLLSSISASVFLTIMFSLLLENQYINIFSNGIYGSRALIQMNFREIATIILAVFSLLSIIQVFMQFKSEKSAETGRFLKSLPIKKEEFFKIKLAMGLINISLAFIVLAIGLIVVRSNNMFWIKDISTISDMSTIMVKANSIENLLKEVGLIYLVVLTFYTFLFMIQYTFTNVVGGVVTGILVWLAPIFIVISSIYALDRIGLISIYRMPFINKIQSNVYWLMPWTYAFDFDFNMSPRDIGYGQIGFIANLGIKYLVSLLLLVTNIILAYIFNKSSKVENENKTIVFSSIRKIFVFGVTICSGLLASTILVDILMIKISTIVFIMLIVAGGAIGYLISRRITRVSNV